MWKNYLKIAFRNLRRNRGYAVINACGLALGFACCILILLYVRDELSYDNFHEDVDRIVFVGREDSFGGRTRASMATPYPMADALEKELPSIARSVRTMWPGPGEVSRNGRTFTQEEGIYHADTSFFQVFTFPMQQGDPATALQEPNTAVISEELAQKHFPGENPIGQTVYVKKRGERPYRITGVASIPGNSYLDFNAVLSMSTLDYAETHGDSWNASMFLTFAQLEEGSSRKVFEQQIVALAEAHTPERFERRFFAQPISGLYLSDLVSAEGFRGNKRYIYIFGAIAAFILLIACINYMNLATARSTQRAREVGVRKTLGAGRGQVARQFLGESVLLSLGAFLLSLPLVSTALPVFNVLMDKELALSAAQEGPFLLLLAGAAIGVGALAGSYPALYLSGFHPVPVLRGSAGSGPSGSWLRRGLVVVQFAAAVFLVVGTAIIYQQLRYTQTKDLGFNGEQVVVFDSPGEEDALRNEILAHPGVRSVTVANAVPGSFRLGMGDKVSEVSSQAQVDPEESILLKPAVVDHSFVETLGLRVVAGRDFARERSSDEQTAYLLNETAARQLGWAPGEAVGKELLEGQVIGVVEDFHIASLRRQIEPVVLSLHEFESVSASSVVAARLAPDALREAMDHIAQQWARFSDEPLEYAFLDQRFANMYRTERRLGQVFSAFALIAVLIACLGLFGLAAYAAERRTKEIGIRKVFGASLGNIVALLSKDFAWLVLIAFVVAAPIAYYAMSRWLQDFVYRIELGPWLFLGAGIMALITAMATVSYQAVRAALTNPADTLRYE